jgi:4a-hydroxytetrahydrobiopterin dehydratase
MATLLTPAQLQAALSSLDGWSGDGSAISRTVVVESADLDALLAELERVAREMDHDPDLSQAGTALTIVMSTHSAGGVTELDVAYAARVNALVDH